MAAIRYLLPSRNIAATADVTSSADDATYPPAFAVNLNPAKPFKLSTDTGWIMFEFPGARRIDVVALIHHNLTAGLEVRIQACTADDFVSLALNTTITIPAYREDDFPVSPWKDLTGVAGYSVSGYQFWRVLVVGTNAAAVAIGEIVLGSILSTLEVNVSWPADEDEDHPLVEHRTDFGVSLINEYGTLLRTFAGEVDTTNVGAASLRTLNRDARGRARAWLAILDPDVNEAWFVRFVETRQKKVLIFVDRNQMGFAVEEVSRGLPL